MPFSHIPKTAAAYEQALNYLENDPKRKRIADLIVEVNHKVESGELKPGDGGLPGGSFIYYNNLGFVRSTKRNSAFFFHPTFTMREPVRSDKITREVLDTIIDFGTNDRGDKRDDCIYWEFYSIPMHLWVSALSQADALELFRQAWLKFGDMKYLEICYKVLNTFTIDWLHGGVRDLEWEGWYLEYPMWVDGKPDWGVRRVLNCQLDCLILLWRFWKDTNSKLAWQLFEKGEQELRQRLESFIFEDGKSGYSWWQVTHDDPVRKYGSYSDAYQGIHIMRTHQLFLITGDKFYQKCRDRMRKIKTNNPYILLPPTTQKFGYRTVGECCPNCGLPGRRCEDCTIKFEVKSKLK